MRKHVRKAIIRHRQLQDVLEYAHVGKQSKSKASGAVVGAIYLGRVLSCSSLQDSWAMPEFCQFSSVIEKAIQFPAPIGKISGSQGVWYIKDQEILRGIQTQQEIAQCNNFEPYRPDLPDLSMPNKKKSLFTPWTKRSPKKVYERKATHTAAAPQNRRMQKREQPRKRKWHPTGLHANQPASSPVPAVHRQEITQSPRKRIKKLDPGERGTAMLSDAQRVAAGRTLPMLTKLMGVHLLGDLQRWNDNALEPRPKLFFETGKSKSQPRLFRVLVLRICKRLSSLWMAFSSIDVMQQKVLPNSQFTTAKHGGTQTLSSPHYNTWFTNPKK